MAPTLASLQTQFGALSVNSVVFEVLSALFGVYVVLFILAVWSTYKHNSIAYKRLRIVTISLFCVLLTHYITRAIVSARARRMEPASDEEARYTVPMQFLTAITKTFAAFISDGLLAWRFYVIHGRPRWGLWSAAVALSANSIMGLGGDLVYLSYYASPDLYHDKMASVSFKISSAWGWFMFVTNTILTGSIIARILYVSRMSGHRTPAKHYGVLLEAIVESATVTWVGLLFYEISAVAPTHGEIIFEMNIGYVMICVLPIFFGISQCLITVRLGLSDDGDKTSDSDTALKSANTGLPSVDSKTGAYKLQARIGALSEASESLDDEQMVFAEKQTESVMRA